MYVCMYVCLYVAVGLSAAFLRSSFAHILHTWQTSGPHRVDALASFWCPSDDSFHRFRRIFQRVKTALKTPKTGRNSKTAMRTAAKRSTNQE